MKYSVGYKPPRAGERTLIDMIDSYDCIAEIYFPWPQTPSGRAPLSADKAKDMFAELSVLRERDIELNLLLNASCWGSEGFSKATATHIYEIIGRAVEIFKITSVTAFSPLVAAVVKQRFPQLRVRASVNLRLGSIEALEQSRDIFDGYTIARELNYDLASLKKIRQWCDNNGKTMQLLANSGCMPHCPVQPFHDNMVAHSGQDNPATRYENHIPAGCWDFYTNSPASHYRFLAGTWIRPEDTAYYEGLTDRLKLATRLHSRMESVIRAYSQQKFSGNLADLTEPGHSSVFAPAVIDNRRFPADWFAQKTATGDYYQLDEYYKRLWPKLLIAPSPPMSAADAADKIKAANAARA